MQSKPVLALLAATVLVFAWSVIGLLGKMQETIKNNKTTAEKIEELQEAKANLSLDIDKLETDKGKEESIREKFGWAKEGEEIIVVVEDNSSPLEEKEQEPGGFWNFLKNLFKK
jgi:hypothetical protein